MKKLVLSVIMLMCAYGVHTQSTPQQQLNAAIYEEEVNGDLEKALGLYDAISRNFQDHRNIVAEALYRMGYVNEKLGNKKAAGYYENVIKNYGDQSRLAGQARMRLNTIYASMNTSQEKKGMVSLSKFYSTPGRVFGELSHNGKYLCQYENLNLYMVEVSTGKKIPITTEARMDSIVVNANPGTWSMDDRKHAYNWHYGKSKFGLKVWDRESGKSTTIVGPGEMIYPLNWTEDGKKILVMLREKNQTGTDIGIVYLGNGSVEKLFSRPTSLWQDWAYISPNGNYVIYTLSSERGDKDIYLYNVKNRTSQLVSGHSANEDQAIWTNDNKSIIFRSDRNGDMALYKWNLKDGRFQGEPELVYEGVNDNINLQSVSNDDEVVLMNFIKKASIKMAEVNLRNGQVIKETSWVDDALDYHYPAWSPDGKRVSMVKKSENGNSDLLVLMDTHGNKEKEIDLGFSAPIGDGNGAFWTSDGKIIITQRRAQGAIENSFVLLNPDTGIQETIRHPFNPNRPIFDGQGDYYISAFNKMVDGDRNDQFRGIYKINKETGQEELIYECEDNMRLGMSVSLSPDQDQLIFNLVSTENEQSNKDRIMLMNLDDLSVKEIYKPSEVDGERWFGFYWHPDGKHITFRKTALDKVGFEDPTRQSLIQVDLHTGNFKTLPAFALGKDQTYQWQKSLRYDIHPSGDRIIYRDAKSTTNFWKLKY